MKKITSTDELKKAILVLEEKQALQGQLLKDQLLTAAEGLKPVNIIKKFFSKLTSSPDLKSGIIATATGLAAFYLAGKTISASSRNPLKKIFGSLLQVGVSSIITQHPMAIKSIGQSIFSGILHKIRHGKPYKQDLS